MNQHSTVNEPENNHSNELLREFHSGVVSLNYTTPFGYIRATWKRFSRASECPFPVEVYTNLVQDTLMYMNM